MENMYINFLQEELLINLAEEIFNYAFYYAFTRYRNTLNLDVKYKKGDKIIEETLDIKKIIKKIDIEIKKLPNRYKQYSKFLKEYIYGNDKKYGVFLNKNPNSDIFDTYCDDTTEPDGLFNIKRDELNNHLNNQKNKYFPEYDKLCQYKFFDDQMQNKEGNCHSDNKENETPNKCQRSLSYPSKNSTSLNNLGCIPTTPKQTKTKLNYYSPPF